MSKPSKVKSVLHDVTITVTGHRAQSREDVPIKLTIKALELTYGPCIDLSISVDVPCEMGWSWDDHPLLLCRARQEKNREEPVKGAGEILDDTPAVRALLAELVSWPGQLPCEGTGSASSKLCDPTTRKLYSGTDTTHRARLIASLEMFWS
jgi:hypothetical protein